MSDRRRGLSGVAPAGTPRPGAVVGIPHTARLPRHAPDGGRDTPNLHQKTDSAARAGREPARGAGAGRTR
ncbi:hypothetical protein GCM10027075_66100 [Streptomyces heilongjiangensis]